jgi:hypothetical protein
MPENVAIPPKALEEVPEAKQRRISKEVQAALLSAGGTVIAAVIAAAAAIYTGVASVPIIDGSTDVAVLEQQNATLKEQVSDLEGLHAESSGTAADLQVVNAQLRAENDDLNAQLADVSEPDASPNGGSAPGTETASSSDLTLAELDEQGRVQAADLEAGTVGVLREAEWYDDAATADAYDIVVLGGALRTRTQSAWSSAAGAPETKAECTAAITANDDSLYTNLSNFAVGDVICMQTSEGAIALLTLTAVDAEANTVAFKSTLFE